MKKYTAEEIQRKFKNRYIKVLEQYDYSTRQTLYEVIATYKTIHEDTTLGQDVGTSLAYTR